MVPRTGRMWIWGLRFRSSSAGRSRSKRGPSTSSSSPTWSSTTSTTRSAPHSRRSSTRSQDGDPTTLLPVNIVVRRPPADTVTLRIWRAVAEGAVETEGDRLAARAEAAEELALDNAAAVDPVVAFLADRDVTPDYVGVHHSTVHATIPAEVVLELAARPDIVRISLAAGGDMGGADGKRESEVLQHRLNWTESYTCGSETCNLDGENGTALDIYAAVIDLQKFRDTHVAFKDKNTTSYRIAGRFDCHETCGIVSAGTWTSNNQHGTRVAGALLGDLRDGQNPSITDPDERETYSAAAGEAIAQMYWVDGQHQGADNLAVDFGRVVDHAIALTYSPRILVSAIGIKTSGWRWPPIQNEFSNCNGDEPIDALADQLFEGGINLVQIAGNDLDDPSAVGVPHDDDGIGGSSTNCTLWDPASAVGSFTVGAFDEGDDALACYMRSSPTHDESSWGGSTSLAGEGRFRSSIDLIANWSGSYTPDSGRDGTSNTEEVTFSGTSHAGPTVGGAMVDFLDMMKNIRGSTLIDDPGMLFAWMLNNGDRTIGSANYTTSGFHQRTGAGRLGLRYISSPGMDAPWYWYHWETCVDDDETVTLPIAGGNTLSSSVDSIRATAFWYDRRFQQGTAMDNIDLYLRKTDGTLLRGSQHFFENKERVYYNDVGGMAVKLELVGWNVTSDGEGCGTNSMRVWVTALVESDARDDADGPAYTTFGTDACKGVKQL